MKKRNFTFKNSLLMVLCLGMTLCLCPSCDRADDLETEEVTLKERVGKSAQNRVDGDVYYVEYDTPQIKAIGEVFKFDVESVAKAGVYEVAPAFDTIATTVENSGIINDAYPTIKSFNRGIGSSYDSEGYSNCVLDVYLDTGKNSLSFYIANAFNIKGFRLTLIDEIDSKAVTTTAGVSTVISGMFYGDRLVQAAQNPIQPTESELVITEDGWYDLSYFSSGANQGEIYFSLTDEIDQTINICSINLCWTTCQWVLDGKSIGDSSNIRCMYTNNSYVVDADNPKDSLNNPYVRLFKGTYKVNVWSRKVRLSGCNWQVYYGGALFAKKVTINEEAHHYEVSNVVAATCDKGEATTYVCSDCGDTYTKITAPKLGHSLELVGEKAADGSGFYRCSRSSQCKHEGIYLSDCGTGIEKNNIYSASITVEKEGLYKVYYEFEYTDTDVDTIFTIGFRNKAYNNACGFIKATHNNAYLGSLNKYYSYLYLNSGKNNIDVYSTTSTKLTALGCVFATSIDAHAVATTGGSSNYISDPLNYFLVHLLVQGYRNPCSITTTVDIPSDGTYDISYLAASANDGNFIIELIRDSETITLHSNKLGDETTSMVSSGEILDYNSGYLSHNAYIYNDVASETTACNKVSLKAGKYTVVIKGVEADGRKQVWFGGELFFTKSESTCDHEFKIIDSSPSSCTENGFNYYLCEKCGYAYREIVYASHDSIESTDTEGNKVYTCKDCGTVDVDLKTPMEQQNDTYVAGNVNKYIELGLNVEKAGIYRFYFDYDYSYSGSITNQLSSPMINASLGTAFYSQSAHAGDFDNTIQSWSYIGSDRSFAYTHGEKTSGYNKNYFDMYLQAGENSIRWYQSKNVTITLYGYRMSLIKAVATYAYTSHSAKNWTATYLSGKEALPGFQFNVIQGSGTALKEVTTTINIAESGKYDLSYFAFSANEAANLKVTLTNGTKKIKMVSYGLYLDENSSGNGATFGKMLYNNNLWDVSKDVHLINLDAGTWTVTVSCTNADPNYMLLYGGALFFSKN